PSSSRKREEGGRQIRPPRSNPLLLLTHGTSFLLPLPLSQTHWRRRLEAQHCTRRPARGAALPPAHRLRLLPRLPVDLKKALWLSFPWLCRSLLCREFWCGL
uniref:Uncharacterized protein n=1 Tax=Aegilops tauschii subsp. strangulata TaxID=200361 RepID=A0A453E4N0_AEGTS